jgi:hypothetical protein
MIKLGPDLLKHVQEATKRDPRLAQFLQDMPPPHKPRTIAESRQCVHLGTPTGGTVEITLKEG